jgi:biopolymer transport protein ExbD
MDFARNTRKLRAISMVSLIDIVFTIILFFLVAGHMEKFTAVAVDLPAADAGQHLDEGPVVVLLGKYGEVAINDAIFDSTGVDAELVEQLKHNPERIITIKADALLEADRLVDFLEAVRRAGGKNLSLVTQSGNMAVAP